MVRAICNETSMEPDTYRICKIFEPASNTLNNCYPSWNLASNNYCSNNPTDPTFECLAAEITELVFSNDCVDVNNLATENEWPDKLQKLSWKLFNSYVNMTSILNIPGLSHLELFSQQSDTSSKGIMNGTIIYFFLYFVGMNKIILL